MKPQLLRSKRTRVIALIIATAMIIGFTATVNASAWPGNRGQESSKQAKTGAKTAKRITASRKDRSTTTAASASGQVTTGQAAGTAVGGAVTVVTTKPGSAPATTSKTTPTTTAGSKVATAPTTVATTAPPTTKAPTTPVAGPGSFLVGWTHTQVSADSWYAPAAIASAENILRTAAPIQNQHIYGWGAMNPEPSPGQYDWSWLDGRINLIRRTGGIPVITLCCAPDWMKGAAPGTTDWARLDVAPDPARFDDFAALSALVAARYPDVKYFQVWNELKGFYNNALNRWDYEGYTTLYNKVYDAVKAVRPDAQLGGPYVVVDTYPSASGLSNPSTVSGPWGVYDQRPLDVIEYWLAHKHGAQFLIVDGGIGNRGGASPADANVALGKFGALHNWIKQRTNLPIWWGEFYPVPTASWSQDAQADFAIRAVQELKNTGAAVALLWQPDTEGAACVGCLWYDIKTQGAAPSALAARLKAWLGT